MKTGHSCREPDEVKFGNQVTRSVNFSIGICSGRAKFAVIQPVVSLKGIVINSG